MRPTLGSAESCCLPAAAGSQATIRQALVDADEAKRRAAEAEEEYKRIVGEARTQARSVVEDLSSFNGD